MDADADGFRYDKVTESEVSRRFLPSWTNIYSNPSPSPQLKDRYLHTQVETSTPFTPSTKSFLNSTITTLISLYAKCVTLGDLSTAKRQLRVHQREHIAWERDTVWRQMIGNARRGDGDGGMGLTALGGSLILTNGEEEKGVDLPTPAGRIKLKLKHLYLLLSTLVFVILLNWKVMKESGEEANRCLAVLVWATLLWATEAIPLFVTSMMIPMLLVCLRVIRSDDVEKARLSTPDATK